MKSKIICCLVCAAMLIVTGCGSHNEAKPRRPGEGTTCEETPFIGVNYAIFMDLLDSGRRQLIEKDIFKDSMFVQETLEKGTPYVTRLTDPWDERSAINVRHGRTTFVLVTAFVFDQSTSRAKQRYGLIPSWAYDEFLRPIHAGEAACPS